MQGMAGTPFFERTYAEATELLAEARRYVSDKQASGDVGSDPMSRVLFSQETMRVTNRLTQVMSWLLCQKAIATGEISIEHAMSDEFAISGQIVCLDDRWAADERLPAAVRDLSNRSLSLYRQIQRLDAMVRGSPRSENGQGGAADNNGVVTNLKARRLMKRRVQSEGT